MPGCSTGEWGVCCLRGGSCIGLPEASQTAHRAFSLDRYINVERGIFEALLRGHLVPRGTADSMSFSIPPFSIFLSASGWQHIFLCSGTFHKVKLHTSEVHIYIV